MSAPVRFVSTSVALAYDSKHDVLIKVVRCIDTEGRPWESYDFGPLELVDSPEEPEST